MPWLIVAFFAVVFAANAAFVYFALSTHSGLETADAYDQGLHYDETLAAAARQAALGWRATIEARRDADGETDIVATLRGPDGQPLDGLTAVGRIVRPIRQGSDLSITFQREGNGRYRARVHLAFPGQWEVRVLWRDEAHSFRITKRVIL